MSSSQFNLEVLSKAMSLRLARHSAIASNIANADTPGYRPVQVSFEGALQKAALTKDSDRLNKIQPTLETIDDGVPRLDGNSVNIDKQMEALSENTILYNATAEFIGRRIQMLKSVIG